MSARRTSARDLVAVAVLALLSEGPTHPYDMVRTIRERRWDFLSGLPRGLYHAVERLTGSGWAEPVETVREGQRPERTVLRITEEGRRELHDWVRDLLVHASTPDAFSAALTCFHVLEERDRLAGLEFRAARLAGRVAELDAQLARVRDRLPRAVLLDDEYRRALCHAELEWVEALIADLVSGAVNWDFMSEEEGGPSTS
ncbi:PadR family transcriptional regulator [Streptoalloteichus hindustanus]|uniref:Transcriptional regulator, PadR family n=1 Tax=Streptoalloteichus hindustanus TaxID=2017 RepID=A0A1M5FGC5_STRHI|nr:PadR family transcriptional regulator [Streptoalloteichus hindustanus]SHF90600.1 transcriptional regulator, PadR family [Streptoalloteichus hindustanus]